MVPFTLMPIVTFFLAVEAMATPGFANHSGLPETDEESIVVPTFQGIHGVIECWGIHLQHRLRLGGIQLSWVDCISVISLFSSWLSVIVLRRLLGMAQPRRG